MNIQLLLILILTLGIVPNLGFFSLSSFFLLAIFGIIAWIILRNSHIIKGVSQGNQWGVLFILLISSYYYGGYYQNPLTLIIGQTCFFFFCGYIFIQLYRQKEIPSYVFIIFFLFLSLLTIYGSPKPIVDSFVILKEAPQKLMQGLNPYDSTYSRVYKNIEPNYFNYLPLSIIYFLPFVGILNDPRYGLIIIMIGTYLLFNKLQKKNFLQKNLYSSLFLFAPRSFYMIEHAYLDTVIFFLFVLAIYFQERKNYKWFAFILSCFFLFKQNIIILFPLFIKKLLQKKESLVVFFIPFLSILVFLLWSPSAFVRNIITVNQPNGIIMKVAPFQMSIAVPNILFQLFSIPLDNMQTIFAVGVLGTLLVTIIIMLDVKLTLNRKIILILFFGYFFSYHAYFNSYYLVLLFLFFDFVLSKE